MNNSLADVMDLFSAYQEHINSEQDLREVQA